MNGLKSMTMKKYKYNKNIPIHENISNLCDSYGLDEVIYYHIRTLCSDSYIKGSNAAYEILKDNETKKV